MMLITSTLVVALFGVVACSSAAGVEAPPAPTMPAHWTISSDVSFAPADIEPVADALGADDVLGEISSARALLEGQ